MYAAPLPAARMMTKSSDFQSLILETLSTVMELSGDLADADIVLRRIGRPALQPAATSTRLQDLIDRLDPDGAAERRAAAVADLSAAIAPLPAALDRLLLLC